MTRDDLADKGEALYLAIQAVTNSPAEASTILMYVHIKLWMLCHTPGTSVDDMLTAYCDGVRTTVLENQGSLQ